LSAGIDDDGSLTQPEAWQRAVSSRTDGRKSIYSGIKGEMPSKLNIDHAESVGQTYGLMGSRGKKLTTE